MGMTAFREMDDADEAQVTAPNTTLISYFSKASWRRTVAASVSFRGFMQARQAYYLDRLVFRSGVGFAASLKGERGLQENLPVRRVRAASCRGQTSRGSPAACLSPAAAPETLG